jgi:hypothetical protein
MARGPDGTDTQPRTDTALFAFLAAKLEGIQTGGLKTWAQELGVSVGADAIRNAVHHAARLDRLVDRRSAARPWVLADWRALDFFSALVRLELGDVGEESAGRLEAIPGVVDLYLLEGGAEAVALVVFERRHERDALKGRLEEFGRILDWQMVEEQRPGAAITTFRGLALSAAAREGLLKDAPAAELLA